MASFSPLVFIRGRLRIARENHLFWYNLLLILVTVLVVAVFPGPVIEGTPSDFRLRAWGMLLQIIGALTVWWDLTESARKFGRPSFLQNTRNWLKRLVFGGAVATGTASLALQITVVGGGAKGRRDTPSGGAPLEDRIATLEHNLNQIDGDLDNAKKRMTDMEVSLQKSIQEEATLRAIAVGQLKQNLHDAVIGNYASLVFGAAWVVVGIIISALAPEIAKTAAGQWSMVFRTL